MWCSVSISLAICSIIECGVICIPLCSFQLFVVAVYMFDARCCGMFFFGLRTIAVRQESHTRCVCNACHEIANVQKANIRTCHDIMDHFQFFSQFLLLPLVDNHNVCVYSLFVYFFCFRLLNVAGGSTATANPHGDDNERHFVSCNSQLLAAHSHSQHTFFFIDRHNPMDRVLAAERLSRPIRIRISLCTVRALCNCCDYYVHRLNGVCRSNENGRRAS